MKINETFTDKDLDQLATEPHIHIYSETIDSKKNDGSRLFKCHTCGFLRKVRMGSEKLTP